MKFLFVALLAVAAGRSHNDAEVLEHEAVELAKYSQPKLDALDQRVQVIFKRGTTIPQTVPGIDAVVKRLTAARDGLIQLRGLVGAGPDGKSQVEKQAAAAAKDRKVADLQELVHDTEVTLDLGLTAINDNLDTVESWIAQYDRVAAAPPPAKAPDEPKPPTPNQPAPAAPPAAKPPQK